MRVIRWPCQTIRIFAARPSGAGSPRRRVGGKRVWSFHRPKRVPGAKSVKDITPGRL